MTSPTASSVSGAPDAVYFVVGDRFTGKYSYAWRLGRGGTSFYIKPIEAALAQFKVSLHGPDPRPGMHPGFKVAIDSSAAETAAAAGGVLAPSDDWRPVQWFDGVASGARRVMRIRMTWDLFHSRSLQLPCHAT